MDPSMAADEPVYYMHVFEVNQRESISVSWMYTFHVLSWLLLAALGEG